jgi:signal transduction histidine kinase
VLAEGRAAGVYLTSDGRGRQVVVRADNADGDCVYLLARIRPRPGEVRDQWIGLGSIVTVVVFAVLLAAGPTVTRIRRLSTAVAKSAVTYYDTPVPDHGRDEVADLGRAFNAAGASIRSYITEVESREQALRSFVANTAHDLATPLTVLQTHLAALEGTNTPEQRDHVASAIREAHYLGSLLRNLSAASRLDGGLPLDLRALDLSALTERVVARYRPLARSAGVELNLAVPDTPLMVTADVTLAEQALGNLIDNAIRYNQSGGHVAVVLDRHSLTVADDGIGVAEQDLASLATRRFRGESARSRRPEGQGLGLSITAEAVDAFGWQLTFARHTPKGLIGTITFGRATVS